MSRVGFRWRIFVAAIVAALLFHWFALPPLVLPLLERKEPPLEVAYVADDVSPESERSTADENDKPEQRPDKPEIDRAHETRADEKQPPKVPDKPDKLEEKKVAEKEPEEPKPEDKKPEDKKPEEKKPEEKKPEIAKPAPPPPPPPPQLPHQIMVDQDKFPDEADNAEAKYLAQKNHRAAQDTRALNTNLVRNQAGPEQPASEPSKSQLPNVGAADHKIAELQKREGKPHEIVRSMPSAGDEGEAKRTTPGKLSMRGLTPKSIDNQPGEKPREGMELSDNEAGNLPMARQGSEGERAGSRAKGARRPNLRLDMDATNYDKIVGESVAEAERRTAARAEISRAPGHWDKLQKKLAMMRSSLENFTPDAHVGNEAELGTRAHPFAAYIAEMHRSIHKMWAFEFLPSLDSKGATNPYNDMERWVLVGVVLKSDGVVEKVTINRPSGYAPFDAAALDAVVSSSPFPPPPESIKSPDGKVYLDWTFHRDDRQCGTFGVFPHILEHTPEAKHRDKPTAG